MASDNLRQVGNYIKKARNNADLALKRNYNKLPKRDRARDTVSVVSAFHMDILVDGEGSVTMDVNFNKPPPDDCSSNCIATACIDFQLTPGGHSLTLANPYEEGSIRVYRNGDTLDPGIEWTEENPSGGQVYVQVQENSTVVVCSTYIIC